MTASRRCGLFVYTLVRFTRLWRNYSRILAPRSARSCSAACAVFFNAQAVPDQQSPDRDAPYRHTLFAQGGPDLVERYIGCPRHQRQNAATMHFRCVRPAVASQRLRCDTTRRAPPSRDLADRTRAHAVSRRHLPNTRTAVNGGNDALAQIYR